MNARPIGLLAVGLVLVTTLAVGFVVHSLVPTMGWAAAFALGAIVSPPDAVSATAMLSGLDCRAGVVTILEGESLVNDATALTALRLAIAATAATAATAFSLPEATLTFVVRQHRWRRHRAGGRLGGRPAGEAAEGPAGCRAGIPAGAVRSLDPRGAGSRLSGVLSVVTAGIVLGSAAPRILTSDTRVLASGVWQMVIFVLNGLVFILIGLQLPTILGELRATWTPGQLAIIGAAVSLTVIVVRMIWVFPATYLPRMIVPGLKAAGPVTAAADRGDPRLGRHAWRGFTCGRARAAVDLPRAATCCSS